MREYNKVARKANNANRAGSKYVTKPIEPRGAYKGEFKTARAFWREYKMEDVITWTPEELDKNIAEFYERYEAKQRRNQGITWWYPDHPQMWFAGGRHIKRVDKGKSQ